MLSKVTKIPSYSDRSLIRTSFDFEAASRIGSSFFWWWSCAANRRCSLWSTRVNVSLTSLRSREFGAFSPTTVLVGASGTAARLLFWRATFIIVLCCRSSSLVVVPGKDGCGRYVSTFTSPSIRVLVLDKHNWSDGEFRGGQCSRGADLYRFHVGHGITLDTSNQMGEFSHQSGHSPFKSDF